MERKFKVGDKVTCTAGLHKHRTGYILKIGSGNQPFYHVSYTGPENTWSHENHLIPFGKTKEKETEMNDLKKMEVGKLYKSKNQKRIIKVLAVSTKGDTFVEVVGGGDCIGFGFIITSRDALNYWEEYTEPKKLYINIYLIGGKEYTGCYPTITASDEAKIRCVNTYGYKFIKRIETEI